MVEKERKQGRASSGTGEDSSAFFKIERAINRLNELRDFLLRQPPGSPIRKRVEAVIASQRICLAMLLKVSRSQGSAS